MRRHLLALSLFALASGCRSRSEAEMSKPEPPPAPLEAAALGKLELSHRLPLGAVEPRPVVVILTESSQSCADLVGRPELGKSFVLCSPAPFESAEPELKDALRRLKKAYPRHLTSTSLALVLAKPNLEKEFDLVLAEASVFSKVLVISEAIARLSPVYLATFGERGGKVLLVIARAPELGSRLALSSGGTGIRTRQFSSGAGDIGPALADLLR